MSEVNDYNLKFRNIELRLNMNFSDAEEVLNNIKNLNQEQYLYIGIGGVEVGEKDNYENVEHIHVLLIAKSPIKVQTHINRIGWKKYKNYNDDCIGYNIMSIDKKYVIDRLKYIFKKKTKVNGRKLYEYIDSDFWDYIDEVKVEKEKAKKVNKTILEVQQERVKIATEMCYDDILTTTDPEVLYHKGFFNKNDGIKFYASVRNKIMEEVIEREGNRYDCIPETGMKGVKGPILPHHNILIIGRPGDGKTQTMEWYVKNVLNERMYTVRATKFMDRYDPRKFDKLFCDELDAKKIDKMGGDCDLKENTCGRQFTYEEKHVKSLISNYKSWWITSNAVSLNDLRDKNDKNDDGSLGPALRRRFHILTIQEFMMNFGIKYISRGVYEQVEPIPLFHNGERYVKLNDKHRASFEEIKQFTTLLRNRYKKLSNEVVVDKNEFGF